MGKSNRCGSSHRLLQFDHRCHHQQHTGSPWSPCLSGREPREKTSGGKTWRTQRSRAGVKVRAAPQSQLDTAVTKKLEIGNTEVQSVLIQKRTKESS